MNFLARLEVPPVVNPDSVNDTSSMNLDYFTENNLASNVKAKAFDSRVLTNDQLLYQSSSTQFVNAYNPVSSPMGNRKLVVKDQNKTS